MTDTTHRVTESADKIVVKTKLTRGEGTRDQDKIDIKVKGDDPDDVVTRLDAVLANLQGTADDLRELQPGDGDE
jgi:hypothetical protein